MVIELMRGEHSHQSSFFSMIWEELGQALSANLQQQDGTRGADL